MDGKTKAIIAHIYWIGWVIALIINSNQKDEITSFYLRQLLGIFLFTLLAIIPGLGWIIGILSVVFWILSLIGAVNGEMKETPVVGRYFQDWFRGL